ncbi:LPS export ABC transporter periplasmic protein LptC [Ottowia sp.]|uniref:LPS export ABC transporter periplasmic protein LptC n=1 Tax=Ottowia sp. TaxID=1898956 RepID=UPI003A8A6D77
MDRRRMLRYGRDQLSAWLPVLLMGLFALGTWWLVRSAPQFLEPRVEKAVSAKPDYFMQDFWVRSFTPEGRLKSELRGTEGRHYPADDTLEVMQPRIQSIDEQGHPTVVTAQRAISNAGVSEVKLYGKARVVREPVAKHGGGVEPRLEFRGEFLHAFMDEDRVSSDQPVELQRGDDQFTGDVFDYSDQTGIANLQGRVRGVIQPRR